MASPKAIVIEIGSIFLKGGYSGESSPRCSIEHGIFLPLQSNLRLHLCELFHKVFVKHLLTKFKLHNVIIVEKMMVARDLRDMIVSVLLRDFQVPAVSMQPDLFMSMLSSGCSSGIVVDIGDKASQAICFVNNRPLLHTWREATVGVSHALKVFHAGLGEGCKPAAVEAVFHQVACCTEEEQGEDVEINPLQLTSGDYITSFPSSLRSDCLECIYTGYTKEGECYDENDGVAGLILQCLQACNHDVRLNVARHVIFIGGGAKISGLIKKICSYTTHLIQNKDEYEHTLRGVIRKLPEERLQALFACFPRDELAWVGASLFGALKESQSAFVTLAQLTSSSNSSSGGNHNDKTGTGIKSTATSSTTRHTTDINQTASGNENTTTSTTSATNILDNISGLRIPDGFVLKAPDWQSADPAEWIFCRTSVV